MALRDVTEFVPQHGGQLVAARCSELNPRLEPGSLKDYRGAPRPADTSLHCAKAQAQLQRPANASGSVRPLAFVLLLGVPVLTFALYLGHFLNAGVAPDLSNQFA